MWNWRSGGTPSSNTGPSGDASKNFDGSKLITDNKKKSFCTKILMFNFFHCNAFLHIASFLVSLSILSYLSAFSLS